MSIYKGDNLIAGGPNRPNRPDWAKAVLLDHKGVFMDGYTAPSNGMIIGWFKFNYRVAVLDLKVNSITVARATLPPKGQQYSSEGNVQCPVNKGDYIKLEVSQGDIMSDDIDAALYFVPFIDGYTGN